MFYRPTWAEIDLDAIISNYRYAQQQVSPKMIIPVIKANAYGHGAKEVMLALRDHGVKMFAVSLLEEALELRALANDIEILMLGPLLDQQFDVAHENNIQFTVYDVNIAQALLKYSRKLVFHLKVDTGMHRYGFDQSQEVIDFMEKIKETNHEMKGIYTHLATANEQNALFIEQINQMKDLIHQLPFLPEMVHISNSSASLRYEQHLDYTTHARLGISLYGLSLDQNQEGLHPAMRLKTKVVEIKTIKKGETVGYGATYQAFHDEEKIAVLPIGYADGFLRRNKTGVVEIKGKTYPIVGIICMDACFVRVDKNINIGDEVILFGGLITIDEVAKRLSTISYEVICQVSERVPRLYVKGGIINDSRHIRNR